MRDAAEERELRARFARMREDDVRAARALDFDRMLDRARPAKVGAVARVRSLVRVAGWATVAAAAAVAGILMTDRTTADVEFDRLVADYATDAVTGAWDSPTAGLLAVPGSEFLRGIPTFGSSALPDRASDQPETGL